MKNVMNTRYTLLLLISILFALPMALVAEEAPTLKADTLQRELVLQRDYVPTGQKAEKKLFNPLDQVSSGLTPIQFVRNSYALNINHHPLLAQPLLNPLAPEVVQQIFHGRIAGGWPLYLAANLGVKTTIGKRGSLGITLDHLSQKNEFRTEVAPFPLRRQTQDSELGITYTTPLWDRLFSFNVGGFYHSHTYHGIRQKGELLAPSAPLPLQKGYLPPQYNSYDMKGAVLGLSLAPAPISLDSRWLYSLDAELEYAYKEDYSPELQDKSALIYRATEAKYDNAIGELYLQANGHLGYAFAGSDWAFGVTGQLRHLALSKVGMRANMLAPNLLLSAAPQVSYTTPTLLFKGGAKVELLNRGPNRLIVVPDITLRWQVAPLLSLYAIADGGAEYMGLRELYQQNRYATALSAYSGYDITTYRVLVGGQVGNYNGFSMDLFAGYAQHSSFGEWQMKPLDLPLEPTLSVRPLQVLTFQRVDAGATGEAFVQIETGYLSTFGLELSGQFRYTHYQRYGEDGAKLNLPIQGLPSFTARLHAAYAFTPKLTAAMDYDLMYGTQFYEEMPFTDVDGTTKSQSILRQLPWIGNLNLCLSYDLHKNIGLSLIGQNLLNRSNMRWAYYHEPSITILGALTLKF